MQTVKFFPLVLGSGFKFDDFDVISIDPIPALDYLKQNQNNTYLLKCPSIAEYLKDVWLIAAPFDFAINLEENIDIPEMSEAMPEEMRSMFLESQKHNPTGTVQTPVSNTDKPMENLDSLLTVGVIDKGTVHKRKVVDFKIQFMFYSDDDVEMELIDPPFSPTAYMTTVGKFNISKWLRPTNFAFYPNPGINYLQWERGEVLYAVKFRSKEKIKLEREYDYDKRQKLINLSDKALRVKGFMPGKSLKTLYGIFKKHLKEII